MIATNKKQIVIHITKRQLAECQDMNTGTGMNCKMMKCFRVEHDIGMPGLMRGSGQLLGIVLPQSRLCGTPCLVAMIVRELSHQIPVYLFSNRV